MIVAGPPGSSAGRRWQLRLAPGVEREPVLQRVLGPATEQLHLGEVTGLGDRRAYLKGSPLRGRARLRHALRRALGLGLPRLTEFENLLWLRDNGFEAPLPLAAGSLEGRAGPRWQFLLTELVEPAEPLGALLEREGERALELFLLAARTAARLHARGFVHRDLYPRNLLVQDGASGPTLILLDAWRGGARRQLRGPAHDLACLLLHAPRWLDGEATQEVLRAYSAGLGPRGSDVRSLRRAVDRARERERRKLVRDPARLRGRPLPTREW